MNKKNWELYKNSSEGRELIDLFSFKGDNFLDDACKIYEKLDIYHDEPDLDRYYFRLQWIAINLQKSDLIKNNSLSFEDFIKFVIEFQLVDVKITEDGYYVLIDDPSPKDIIVKKDNFRGKLGYIQYVSMFLYFVCGFYKPILFPRRHNLIEENAELLDIELPEPPRTKSYEEYYAYYYELSAALTDFQINNELTDAEFCACFYGFTSLLRKETKRNNELPEPTNVWMTGANKEDYKTTLSNITSDTNSIWACNERTRRGDIVIIYALAPHSCIHSIWRADSGGRFQPFDYYQCRTTVRDGVTIPPISIKDLKEHPYFKNLPIVRKNLQGVNGVELSAIDYYELLKLIAEKGGDLEKLPKLFVPKDWKEIEYEKGHPERSVEEKILIPVLERLGYTSNDWTRQLVEKVGRKEKEIPDFVFFPFGEEHAENAPMVIEAKYDMSSSREREKAYQQARSYAKMLDASIMGICDKERLVLFVRNKNKLFDYSNPVFEAHWASIYGDLEVASKLRKLIGREIIKDLRN